MKKFAISLVAILSVVVMALSFAGCGASGKYKFESMTVKILGSETTVKAGEEYNGQELSKDSFVLELNSDGTCSFTAFGSDSVSTGTWEEEDGVLKISGFALKNVTRDGSRITFEYSFLGLTSATITLKK